MKLAPSACLLLLAVLSITACGEPASLTYRRGLNHYQEKRYDQAFPLVREAAEAGNANARAVLGVMYLYGRGTPADGAQAERWLLAAADEGVVDAQSVLGLMYGTGAGVARNETEARRWLERAAAAGDAPARLFLERMAPPPGGSASAAPALAPP